MNIFFWKCDNGGSGYYRMELPSSYLDRYTENNTRCKMIISSADIEWADIIVVQRRCSKNVLEIIKKHKHETKFVYELDDDLWHIPEGNPSKRFWSEERIKGAEAIMRECVGIITTNGYLARRIRDMVEMVPIYVIPNFVEVPTIQRQEIEKDKTIIAWAGSNSHCVDFDSNIINAIKNIKKKYQDKVEFIFFGYAPIELKDIITFINWQEPKQFLNMLYMCNIDIGLIINADIEFNKSRSNLKFLEYTVCDIVSVELTNMSSSRYLKYLCSMIDNPGFYKESLDTAKEYVENNFMIEKNIDRIENVFKRI